VRIFATSRDCGICLQENRRSRSTPSGITRKEAEEAEERLINTCKMGCPHVNGCGHSVCVEHWPSFIHN
jgi:hypothetical protein